MGGMEGRGVVGAGMGRHYLRHDVVKRKGRGVDDPRARRAMRKNLLWHKRAGIETDRTGGDKVAPAQGEQVGRAGAGADEMHRHGSSPSAIAAVAVLSRETVRVETRRPCRPTAATAAASASEPTPRTLSMRSERVGVSIPASSPAAMPFMAPPSPSA